MKIEKKGSATIGIAVFVAVLMVIAAFIYGRRVVAEAPVVMLTDVATSSLAANASLSTIDTDKDGLMDWEEVLWKTDPHNADSDQDGTKDGDEVITKRNPTIRGPGDTISQDFANNVTAMENLTLTDSVSRQVFTEYWKTRVENGDVFDVSKSGDVIVSALSQIQPPKPRVYTEGDVTVQADNSEAALRIYAEQVGAAIKRNAVKNENELIILERSMNSNDEQGLSKMDPTITSYRTTIDAMLAVPVPHDLLSMHLSILNSLSATLTTIQTFRNALSDPVAALIGISQYLSVVKSMKQSFESVAAWYRGKGITFGPSSDAQYLVGLFQ